MKLVLSRKGFDSSSGGAPSPILPDRTMFSLPVPLARSVKTYNDIRKGRDESTMVRLVEDLTGGNIGRDALAHLDPDLHHAALDRAPGWRPCFGQTDAAQTHLEGCGVGRGDLFLFFGWFRQVRKAQNGRWAIHRNSPNLHVIFGWLQIGEVINVAQIGAATLLAQKPWLRDHPHPYFKRDSRNTIYIASDRLVLPGIGDTGLPGAGEFGTFDERLVLTAPEATHRSRWALPSCFAPDERGCLTYHSDPSRWTTSPSGLRLEAAARGQEFVLDCSSRPDAAIWIRDLLSPATAARQAA